MTLALQNPSPALPPHLPSRFQTELRDVRSQPATHRSPKLPPRGPVPSPQRVPRAAGRAGRGSGAGAGLAREHSASPWPSLPGPPHPTACLQQAPIPSQPGNAGADGCLGRGRGWGPGAATKAGCFREEADTHPQPGPWARPAAPGPMPRAGSAPARTRRAVAPAGGGSGRRS